MIKNSIKMVLVTSLILGGVCSYAADLTKTYKEAQLKSTDKNLMLTVIESYFAVIKASNKLSLTLANKDIDDKILKLSQAQYQSGVTSLPNAGQAQNAYRQATANVAKDTQQLTFKLNRLQELTGRKEKVLFGLKAGESLAELQQSFTLADQASNAVCHKIQSFKGLMEASEDKLDEYKSGYTTGKYTQIVVLNAERVVNIAQYNHLNSQYDCILSLAKTKAQVSSLMPSDLDKINYLLIKNVKIIYKKPLQVKPLQKKPLQEEQTMQSGNFPI